VRLYGTETGAKDLSLRENAGKFEIYDEVAAARAFDAFYHESLGIQRGRTSVSFPFAVVGEENVSATITFPRAFTTTPVVVAAIEGIDVGIVNVSATTTDFTITVRDDKGTDYTTSQTATVNWIAILP